LNREKLEVKGILLDLDGTIVDSREAYLEAAKTAFATLGKEPPERRVALEIPKRLEQGLPITDLVGTDVESFLEVYLNTYYAVTGTRTKPMPNVQTTLDTLSRRAKLALITMRFVPKTAVAKELQQFGLTRFFTYIVTALDTHKPKPSPEALIKAVKALDVNLCSCAIVGDSVTDVQAGKSAEILTVAVLSGLFSRGELELQKPDLILNDVTELPSFLHFSI